MNDLKLLKELKAWARQRFELGSHSVHGADHWKRVELLGVAIGSKEGADLLVVQAFAWIHDVARESDGPDPDHGLRSAEIVLNEEFPFSLLREDRRQTLAKACAGHSKGMLSKDPTIATCWDADRLGLIRCGISVRVDRLSTRTARTPKLLRLAESLLRGPKRRSRRRRA